MRLWRNWQTRYFEGVVFTRRVGSSPTNRTIESIAVMGDHGVFCCCYACLRFSGEYARIIAGGESMAPDTEEVRRALYREIVQSLTLMDDIFMTAVFQNSLPCVDLVLQIILEKPNLRATRVVTQGTLKNLHGHDVRLDIHAFADGQEFNIEIQRAKRGVEPRRARYHSSMMDANVLPEGTDYKKLPESYVIFRNR